MWEKVKEYFSEFKILKEVTKDFWIIQAINFLDSLGYFTMITIITLFLSNNIGFSDVGAGTVTGTFIMIISASIFVIGPVVDQLGVKRSIILASLLLMVSRGGLAIVPTIYSWIDPKGYEAHHKRLQEKQKKILEAKKKKKKADPLAPAIEECKKKKAQKNKEAKGAKGEAKKDQKDKGQKAKGAKKKESSPWTIPQYIALVLLFLLAIGTTMIVVAIPAGIRRYTDKRTRGTGFNFYYLIMNVAAAAAGLLIDALRDETLVSQGNERIFAFGFMMSIGSFLLAFLLSQSVKQVGEEEEGKVREQKNFIAIAAEVVREKAFWRFMLFIFLLLGVRLTFTQMFLVMPKYYLRVLGPDAPIGFMNAINPIIIVIGLILFIPILNKFKLFPMILLGTTISALSMFILAIPGSVFNAFGLSTIEGYKILIYTQIVVFAIGEVIWSPRLVEYTASIAPPGREGSYMGLSRIPEFLAKFANGPLSGYLLMTFSPQLTEDCRPLYEALPLPYLKSPEMMWVIYGTMAIASPILILLFKNVIKPEGDDKKEGDSPKVDDKKEGENSKKAD